MPKKGKSVSKKSNQPVLVVILLVLLFIAGWLFWYGQKLQNVVPSQKSATLPKPPKTVVSSPTLKPSPTPTPTPKPIPHGKWGFSVSQADKTKPQFGRGFLEPYDPPRGSKQKISISVTSTQPVTTVTGLFKTDNADSGPIKFNIISGTTTNGIWEGTWTVNDSYFYNYNLILTAQGGTGKQEVEITFR